MIPIIAFVGEKKSGKTMMLEKVIGVLAGRGIKVGVVKHTGHGFRFDYPETDTHRLYAAGANMVAISGTGELGLYGKAGSEADPEAVRDLFFPPFDLVLAEGFKRSNLPKIVVAGSGKLPDWARDLAGLIAVVSPKRPGFKIRHFRPGQIAGLADLLEGYIQAHRKKREVQIYLDGKRLQLKPFIKDFFLNSITAMVGSLRDAGGAKRIQISIDLPEGVTVPRAETE